MTRTLHTATLGVLALLLSASFALPLHAQDRSDDQRDQPTQERHATSPTDERRGAQDETRQGAPDENRRAAPQDDRTAGREDARRGNEGDVDTLRRAHPRASARCHDGFFTTTRERARACSKHGGIDIWLAL